MAALRRAWARLIAFLRKDALDSDLDAELAAHVDLAIAEHVRRGVTETEARRLALARLGGLEAARLHHREARGLPWLDGLVQDVRYAVRSLRRSPGFTLTAVVTLAIGTGVNAAVFAVADAVLFKGFRLVDGNSRILYIGTHKEDRGGGCCVSYPDLLDWRAATRVFEDLGAFADLRITLSDTTSFPETYSASLVTANSFHILGQRPFVGRDFTPADERPGAAAVAILGYRFWERRYGKDVGVVGRTVRINGEPATVIGVMPAGFTFPQNQDLWLPLVPTPDRQRREARGLWFAFGRMADGETFESARMELETIGHQLGAAYPQTNAGWVPTPHSFTEFFVDPDATMTYGALWAAVGFVLLIACANLANLMLARAIGRTRELSVRVALGAGRWRIVRQLLVESLMLAGAGGLAGWWLASAAVRTYAAVANPPTQAWSAGLLDYTMDGRALVYLIAISAVTGLIFGLLPAFRLARFDLNGTLKDGGRGAAGSRRQRRFGTALVAAEMALAIVLLAGAGVMIRSFMNVYTTDLGIEAKGVVAMFIGLRDPRYAAADAQVSFFDRLSPRLAAIPGVESVAIAKSPPDGSDGTTMLGYELAGAPPVDAERRAALSVSPVGSGYFQTLGATMRDGREFDDFDNASSTAVAVVNERFATASWPGTEPIGQRFRVFDGSTPGPWLTVVGVVSNIRSSPSRGEQGFEPRVYVPYRQRPGTAAWVYVRSRLPIGSLTPTLRREVQNVDPDLPIWLGPFKLDERLAGSGAYWSIASHTALFLLFAAIALLLAASGLYAVIAHSVGQRTQEIGVRLAVGGTARDIFGLVLRQGLAPLGLGLAIGLVLSVALTRVLRSELVGVSPADPVALGTACLVLLAAALLGCLIPARRAMRVDPVVALRHE